MLTVIFHFVTFCLERSFFLAFIYSKYRIQRVIHSFFRLFLPDEALTVSLKFLDYLFAHGVISVELRDWGVSLASAYHELLAV